MVHTKTFLCCFPLEIGGIFLGWFGIVYNALCLFAVPMMSYGVKKYKEAIENSQYSRMSNYGGYGSYRGYRDLDRVVRSISDNQVAKSVANISGGIMTFLIVLFCLSILMKLAASILLLIGTKNRNHRFVLAYLIFEGIHRFFSMCTSVVTPFYAFVDLFWIYVAVSTYSMYKKFEKESRLGTNFELTSINAAVNPQMSGQSMQSNFQQNLKMSAAQ